MPKTSAKKIIPSGVKSIVTDLVKISVDATTPQTIKERVDKNLEDVYFKLKGLHESIQNLSLLQEQYQKVLDLRKSAKNTLPPSAIANMTESELEIFAAKLFPFSAEVQSALDEFGTIPSSIEDEVASTPTNPTETVETEESEEDESVTITTDSSEETEAEESEEEEDEYEDEEEEEDEEEVKELATTRR